jgi:hypothetical protein
MREVVTFPDAEKAVIDYLLPVLAAYQGGGIPIDVRGGGKRFVRVRRVGGTELTVAHDSPVLDVLVWHDTDFKRMALAQHLWAALRAADGDETTQAVLLYQSTTLGPRQMPDPADPNNSVAMFTVSMLVRSL